MKRTSRFLLSLCLTLLWTSACKPGSVDLQVIDFSDWHGQIDPQSLKDAAGNTNQVGGAGLLSAYFKKDRAENPDTLIFTGGDAIGATPALSSFFQDKPAIIALNGLNLDATTFGNHDFDSGISALKDRMSEANYAFISTNLSNVKTELGTRVTTPYHMYEVGKDKVKVAVLGLTNPDAPTLQFPGAMGSMEVQEPIATANAAAKQARDAGAVVVIALAHLGALNTDAQGNPVGPLIELAKGLAGVDVLLGDHTDFLVNTTINDVLVVENRSKGQTYARVAVKVVDGKITSKTATIVNPIGVSEAPLAAGQSCPATACPESFSCNAGKCQKTVLEADPEMDDIKSYREQLATQLDGKIATIDTTFTRDGTTERKREVPIGDLVTDALLDRYRAQGAQLAFTNGGGLRAPIPSSYITKDATLHRTGCSTTEKCDVVAGDVYTLLPFGNTAVVRKITGAVLWQALEHSVTKVPNADGRFLQISGFKFEFSASAAPGSRVTKVTLDNGQDIPRNDSTEYTIVTNDFTNGGGDGYTMLVESSPSQKLDVMADVVLAYVKAKGALSAADYPGTRIVQNP